KAAINNPNVSDEAKEHSRQVIDELESQSDTHQAYENDKNEVHINAEHMAALKNPNVSQEAKNNSREYLEEHDAL
ncbi:hypothetical protein BKA93DRAFT_729779, partial [Sparassis latifolia]